MINGKVVTIPGQKNHDVDMKFCMRFFFSNDMRGYLNDFGEVLVDSA